MLGGRSLALGVGLCLALVALCAAEQPPVDLSATPIVSEGLDVGVPGTDTTTLDRENEAISSPVAQRKIREGAQQFAFQAEVNRLMDIIIHSLYSNKDIFLRELISNASDALDKIRFLALTDKSLLGEGDTANLEIKISLDKANNVLYIRDRGIGMTKDDLIKNLGTIAKSGTSAFLEKMQKGGDMNLIGQFGVGFYSVYLVADWVEVITKHNDDKQYIWASGADGGFSISEDTENEPLGRGTMLKIHLKPEALEYAETAKLKELVSKYSEFMNFPIYLQVEKEVEVPEDDAEEATEDSAEDKEGEEEDKEAEDEKEGEDDVEDEEETPEEKEEPKKTRKEKRLEWDLLNDNKAIWLRKPKDVSKEEHQKFYKAISKDYGDALTWTHFKAEGDVEFRAVLYVPKQSPYDFYDKYYEASTKGVKLYVRRVFISDEFQDLLPRWLSFLRGLVDSDTLPLNVSREMLQAHSSLKTIKKKLVRKVLDLIKKMADNEVKCKEKEKEDAEKKAEDKEEEEMKEDELSKEECEMYGQFYEQYGKAIKLGIIEDNSNRQRLSKLLRFYTSKSPDKLTSLDEYIARAKPDQKSIYYLTGSSREEVANSPFLEGLLSKGYEVIYFTDVLDEYMTGHLQEYDDKKLQNASKDELKLTDKDDKEKKRDKELKEEFKPLTKWWKELLGEKISNVRVSNRLATTPCVVVSSKYGASANMERITRAQAFNDPSRGAAMRGQRILEINPRHSLVRALLDKSTADEKDASATEVANVLYETALLESGFAPDDLKSFSRRIYDVIGSNLGVKPEAEARDETGEDAEEEAPATEDKADDGEEAADDADDSKDEL